MGRKKMTPETPTSESSTSTPDQPNYNKSARIRELFESGITEVKQIEAHLKADGQEVSKAMIYTVLNQYKKSKAGGALKGGKKRGPKPGSKIASGAVVEKGRISIADLQTLSTLVKSFGGVDHVIEVLQALKAF